MFSSSLVDLSKKVGIIAGAAIGACTCLAGVGAFIIWLHVLTVINPAKEIAAAQSEKDKLRYEALTLQNQQIVDGIKMVSDLVADGVYTKKQIDEMKRERDQRSDQIEASVHRIEARVDILDARLARLLRK